jgi:predicted cobalt transporter CbtA
MLAFRPALPWAVAALGLIALPHLIGAPQLQDAETSVPEALSRQFVVAVTLTTFLSWTLLGGLSGYFLTKFAPEPAAN